MRRITKAEAKAHAEFIVRSTLKKYGAPRKMEDYAEIANRLEYWTGHYFAKFDPMSFKEFCKLAPSKKKAYLVTMKANSGLVWTELWKHIVSYKDKYVEATALAAIRGRSKARSVA
jgi:hypothetical protein